MLRRVATGSGGFFWSADGVFGAGALQVAPELIQVVLGVFQAGVGSLLHFLLGELVYGGLRKLLVDVVLVEVVFATVHGGRQVGKGWYSFKRRPIKSCVFFRKYDHKVLRTLNSLRFL